MTAPFDPTRRQHLLAAAALPLAASPAWAGTAATPPASSAPAERRIVLDLARANAPLDRFFDHCVGSDYPGTLDRDDSLGQPRTTVDELGFRYLRFHAIFHDMSLEALAHDPDLLASLPTTKEAAWPCAC